MCSQLVVVVVVEAFDGRLLDRSVHSFNLTIGPRVVWFRQAVLNLVGLTDHVEPHLPRICCVPVSGLLCELDAVIGEDRVDAVRHSLKQMFKELPRGLAIRLFHELGDGKPAAPINAHKEVELALRRVNLGDVDMKKPIGYRLKRCRFGLSPSTSGKREMPCRCRHRCSADLVRCGMDGWRA